MGRQCHSLENSIRRRLVEVWVKLTAPFEYHVGSTASALSNQLFSNKSSTPALNSSINHNDHSLPSTSPHLRFRAKQQFPDAKGHQTNSNVVFRMFEHQFVEQDYVSMASVFLVVRTLQSAGKPKTKSDTASNENSTLLAAEQNRQQHSRPATVDSDPQQRCNDGLRNRNTSPTNCRHNQDRTS